MVERVFKYPLNLTLTTLKLPYGSEPLYVGYQDKNLYIWIRIEDQETEMVDYHFETYGTGYPMGDYAMEYIGTIQEPNGLVWHTFWVASIKD